MSSNVIPATGRFRGSYGLVSIRGYLLLLIAAILVPMLVLAGVLAWHYASASRRTIEAERLDVANNLTYLIDREIGHHGGLPERHRHLAEPASGRLHDAATHHRSRPRPRLPVAGRLRPERSPVVRQPGRRPDSLRLGRARRGRRHPRRQDTPYVQSPDHRQQPARPVLHLRAHQRGRQGFLRADRRRAAAAAPGPVRRSGPARGMAGGHHRPHRHHHGAQP